MNTAVLKKLRVRTSVLHAVLWLSVAWVCVALVGVPGLWPLAFVAVLAGSFGVLWDVGREGFFQPLLAFSLFSLLVVLVDLSWMAVYLGEAVPFFTYEAPLDAGGMALLAREQVLLLTGVYAGYLLLRGVSGREIERVPARAVMRGISSLWWVLYLLGLLALLALIVGTGGFGELLANLGKKYERAEGNAGLVLTQYFAYVGILLWYGRNAWRPFFLRYGGLLALTAPLLLSGSRVGLLICVVAALFIDEKTGRRPNLGILAIGGVALAVFFALYQAFRGQQQELDLLLNVYKDLSMGTGFVIASQEGLMGTGFRPDVLLLAFSPFTPGEIKELLAFPRSPDYLFTQYLFPGTQSTFSVGVMGEANHVLPSGWTFFYYLAIGAALTWVGSHLWKGSILAAAVVAGGAVRIAKSGIASGTANILMLLVPVVFAYLLATLIRRATESANDPEGDAERTAMQRAGAAG